MTDFEDDKTNYLTESFTDLKLSGKEICTKEFEGCTFSGCDFSQAKLSRCRFVECQFIRCNLSNVNISYSRFSDVLFDECKLIGVDWTKAEWPSIALCSPVKFCKCIMNDSTFFGLSLEEVKMEECKAHNVDFREGNFSEANFRYTDFFNSLFSNTNLTGADFTEAISYRIDFFHNEIKRAIFSRSEAVSLLDCLEIELVD
ncbi:MAG: pentapeptide repeat-containing protein [Proteobacteria bacterium]|nr:pentapeptide repeat-containing protein [Pseudomonadota bacterium]